MLVLRPTLVLLLVLVPLGWLHSAVSSYRHRFFAAVEVAEQSTDGFSYEKLKDLLSSLCSTISKLELLNICILSSSSMFSLSGIV